MSNASRNIKYLTIAKKYLMSKGIRFETNPPKQKQIRKEYIKLEKVDAKFHDKKSFVKFIISECAREGSPIFVQLKPIEINKARNEKRKLDKVVFYQQEQKNVFYNIFEYSDTAKLYTKVFELVRLNIKAFDYNIGDACEHFFYMIHSRRPSRAGFFNMENTIKIVSLYEQPIRGIGFLSGFIYRMKIKKMFRQIERDISWFS